MVLVQKWPFFQLFFLGNKGQENVFQDITERENPFLGYKNKKFKKSKNCHFSKGVNPRFWSKNGPFSNFYFLCNIDQENVFYDILEQKKKAFLGHKNKNFKKPKNRHFLKGVNPWFWSKNGPFSNSFFWAIQARKISFTILFIQKTPLQPIKKSSKSGKTDIFPKGLTNSFGPKLAIFPNFFFRHYRPGKRSFTIFQNKKTPLQAIKTKSSKNRKIDFFPKGLVNPWFWCKNGPFSNFFFQATQARKISFTIFCI